ncbi:hypothetical protein SLS63_007465 [Diaporthe eres]|uniref:Uncharacterized protein n=1 Tax=Diaporthe eres TaxID=83184 RepID=A0ABR1P5D0_DIAER
MAEKAKQRLHAMGKQVAPAVVEDETFEDVPPIKQVGPVSNGPRAQGKVVIITGVNSPLGIGRATAHQFAQNGAKAVYICDFDDKYLGYHERQIKSLYPAVEVHTRKFDAADEEAVKEVVDNALSRYGRLDVMFANAGIVGDPILFSDTTKEDFMNVLRVNTLGPFLAAKHAARAMVKTSPEKKASGGSIIMTASVAGIRSNAGPTPYSASKSGVINMATTMAYQLAGSNIRVNAICPGVVETGMTAPMYESARARGTERKIGQLNPLKRGSAADEVARVALFLGSDESSYVNGQAWAVDGGLSAGHPFVPLFALVAAFGLFTSAKPVPAQDNGEAAKTIKFLLSGQDYVYTARRDGGVISLDSKSEKGDLTLNPTWLVPSNVGFLISDANSGAMIDTTYNKQSNNLTVSGHYYQGSVGVGHMTYNKNSTRLLASTSVGVDIWDSSASNGSLELLGSFSSDDNSTGSYITQVVPDPSGKIYVVSDRTANSLIILSAIDDNDIKPLGTIAIQESCGPRRGAFYAADGQNPTRYFALCQSTKELLSLEVDLSKGTFKLLQRLQTSVDTNGDKRSVADLLLQTNSDRSADLYVTNTFLF